MPGVEWHTGRLLSVPDEGTSGGGEDRIYIYILKYRSPGGHSEHAHPKITNSGLSNSSSTSTLSQRGLNSNISKIGTANHINWIVLLYHLRRFYAVIYIIHQTCAQACTNIPSACVHVMITLNQSAPYGTLLVQTKCMTQMSNVNFKPILPLLQKPKYWYPTP